MNRVLKLLKLWFVDNSLKFWKWLEISQLIPTYITHLIYESVNINISTY